MNNLTRYPNRKSDGTQKQGTNGPLYLPRTLQYCMFPEGTNRFIIQRDGLVVGLCATTNEKMQKVFKTQFPKMKKYTIEHAWEWIFQVERHCQIHGVYIESSLLWRVTHSRYGFIIGQPTEDTHQAQHIVRTNYRGPFARP